MDDFEREVAKIHRRYLAKKIWDTFMWGVTIFVIIELWKAL